MIPMSYLQMLARATWHCKEHKFENRNWTTTVNDLSTIVNDCQRFNLLSIDFLYLMMRGPVDQRRSFALERKSRHTLTLPNVWDW